MDLTLYPGEVVGFAGLLGSGRTELARLVYGADKPDRGEITMGGGPVTIHSPAQALSKRSRFRVRTGVMKESLRT